VNNLTFKEDSLSASLTKRLCDLEKKELEKVMAIARKDVPSFMNSESEYDVVFIKLYDSLHTDWPADCTSYATDTTTSNKIIQEWRENKEDYPHQISFKSENNLKVTVSLKFILLTVDQCLSIPSSGDPVVDEHEGTNNLQTLLPTASYALRHAQWMWKLLHQ
jgi:hypothetical protein